MSYIEHNGKKILYVDYSTRQSTEETIKVLEEAAREFKKSPIKLLSLDNYSSAFASEEFMKRAKELGTSMISAKREKGAIIGLTGIKKLLFIGYSALVKDSLTPFDTKEEALVF